ncbi:hypothetical protein KL933_002160 [Ogataea haglerorum]|uniref:RING-type E3 ubiquitin transferase n=1 Tax=Ogataea haglerorum TaxID=1937702 RepID=A0AAN6D6H9_9ASCO|nr:uncharacterized protein KL911_002791 [Ogataea haglerorum]KAG7728034.1 hypothetical protein KL933_002160 [Ogataea haglerorum]KAG7738437.1 hypothetical protein KL923_003134 [Ogataea haglerorum]KAG7747671.1 hypothetical protein KL912_003043 [Ogataea haglerorum]KAG7753398.1 hypothetical protein KL911_002791 [Ogataea haglerorum]
MPQINRGQLLLFIIFLTFLLPSAPPEEAGYLSPEERKRMLGDLKDTIRTARTAMTTNDYASGYGNVTGYKLSYGDAVKGRKVEDWPFPDHSGFLEDEKHSILPNKISQQAWEIWSHRDAASGAFWRNITSTLRGEYSLQDAFVRIPMPIPEFYQNLTEYSDITSNSTVHPGNVTDEKGLIELTLHNFNYTPESKDTTIVSVSVKLSDLKEQHDHNLRLQGAYHQETGNLVAVSNSGKFNGIYGLPHLNLEDGRYFNQTRALMESSVNRTDIDSLDMSYLEDLLEKSANCEYIAYMHFEATNLTSEELEVIDTELETPLGRPHKPVPKINLVSGLLYSPDCGLSIRVNKAVGPRDEVQQNQVKNVLLFGILLMSAQIWLFVKQMGSTNTPSTMSCISFWSVATINLVDGSLSMISLLCSLVMDSLYIQFAVCAFLAFTCSSIFEMRYMILIYAAQINERNISWRTAFQGTPIDERENNNENNNENTQPNQANPVTTQDEQTISGQLYMRFFFSLIVFSFLVLNVTLWPKPQRVVFEYIIGLVMNSFWIPQIYRNVIRGSRRSFRKDFIIGTSIIRLLPIMYVTMFKNPFYHHRDYKLVTLLTLWMALQVFMLYLQELLGPRFFLPDKYLPKTYDYHPVLSFDDLENSFNVDHEVVDTSHSHSRCKIDCTICMNSFEVPVLHSGHDKEDNSSIGLMARRSYMVTPCRHIFHTECLENWMKYKLQCPVCRNSLPPL